MFSGAQTDLFAYQESIQSSTTPGISEPVFYGDLFYRFKRIVGKLNFSDQFKKIIKRYMDIMRQSACLVVNSFKVDSYDCLFNCTTVGQASDLITTLN